MMTRIHVNQHIIRANSKGQEPRPPLTVKTYKGNLVACKLQGSNLVAWGVFIQGSSRVVYSPDKPLSCGAKVWIETDSEVIIDG